MILLLVTRGRGAGDPQSNLSWQSTQRETWIPSIIKQHMETTPWTTTRGPSTNKKEYIPHMSVLFYPTSWNSVPSCPTYMTELVFAVGIYWYMCGCNFTTYMRLIWEKRSESVIQNILNVTQKIKPLVNVILIEQCWNLILLYRLFFYLSVYKIVDHQRVLLIYSATALVKYWWTTEAGGSDIVRRVLQWWKLLFLTGLTSCLDWRFLMRDSMSRWPAEYCSITSITHNALRLSLNLLLDTRNRIILRKDRKDFN